MNRSQVSVGVGLVCTLSILALLIWLGGREESALARAASIQQARAVETGAALFEQNCRACHGANGEGVGALGPALNDEHFFTARLAEVGWTGTLAEYIAATVANGRVVATRPLYAGDGTMVMPPWAQEAGGPLRPDEIQALTAFVLNWRATATGDYVISPLPTPTPVGDADELARRGQELFAEAGCRDCHAIAGVSSAEAGPDLSQIGSVASTRIAEGNPEAYVRESVLLPAAVLVDGYAKTSCGGVLTESQLDMLVDYLLTLR